jgi:hypothetical protein
MGRDERDGRPPEPPDDWPAYLRDPITRQGPDRLREVAAFARQLAEYRERRAPDEPLAERLDDERVEDVREAGDGFVVVKGQRCGKDGCRCADGDLHGPYRWRVEQRGDGYEWTYLGKAGTVPD